MQNTATLYDEMKTAFDYSPVVITMVRQHPELSEDEATELLQAFLQWISLVPHVTPDAPIQMLESVDRAWHAFILNTRLYREFCDRFFDKYVDHDPLDPLDGTLPKKPYARYTLRLLREEFGERVHPALLALEQDVTCCYSDGAGGSSCS